MPAQLHTDNRSAVGKWRTLIIFFLLGMVVLHAAILWQMRGLIAEGYGDFAAFYTAGKLVQHGQASAMYDRRAQWSAQQEFAADVKIRRGPLPYIRPPFEALVFFLLAYLRYPVAYLVWTTLKILILFAIPFLLQPHLLTDPLLQPLLQGVLALAYFPVAFELLQGQDAILFFLLFCLAFAALQRGADFRAGVWLALGLFKFHLVIPIVLIFALRRKTRVVFGFLCSAAALLLISAGLVGWAGIVAYPKYLWSLNQASGVGMVYTESMPNLRGLAGALGLRGIYSHWIAVPVAAVGIIVAAYLWRPADDQDRRLSIAGFSLSIVLTILTSYYAYCYDMMLLLIPIVLLGNRRVWRNEPGGWPQRLLVACMALLLFSPLYWVLTLNLNQFYWMAVVLLLLAVALAGCMKRWREPVA